MRPAVIAPVTAVVLITLPPLAVGAARPGLGRVGPARQFFGIADSTPELHGEEVDVGPWDGIESLPGVIADGYSSS